MLNVAVAGVGSGGSGGSAASPFSHALSVCDPSPRADNIVELWQSKSLPPSTLHLRCAGASRDSIVKVGVLSAVSVGGEMIEVRSTSRILLWPVSAITSP